MHYNMIKKSLNKSGGHPSNYDHKSLDDSMGESDSEGSPEDDNLRLRHVRSVSNQHQQVAS